jgi:amino acid permease
MIAMSGTVGIGLFLNSSKILALAGSAGALIAYLIVGVIVTCVMFSLAEMVSFLPISGAIYEYPKRFVDPALGFSVGWMYWMVYASGGATLSTSAAMLSRYWEYDFGLGTVIALIIFLLLVSNILGVRIYGDLEYVVGIGKILLTVGLIILMLAINRGGKNQRSMRFTLGILTEK